MQPIVDHIQITVKDLDAAERFYDQFLPIVGFDARRKYTGASPVPCIIWPLKPIREPKLTAHTRN